MDIKKILSQMTLEEKAAMCQGADAWHTVAVPHLGVPAVMVSDGPHGLRKINENGNVVKAVCFPTAAGTACSFDEELLESLGDILGQSAQAENVGVILGPAANIKRSPLCGRNFEYFSEDPLLSGRMAGAYIRGVQHQGVGTSLKHYAANNQETRRQSISASISPRALREIYLASFEHAVKSGHPWTLMCSYNKINGTYASENEWLLTDVLRDDWGFDGAVMTDWGACSDHVAGVAAGLELEMPRACDEDDEVLADAVRTGRLPEQVLDRACERMLQLADRVSSGHREEEEFDKGLQHHQARKFARESMVLLKNDNNLLPIRGNKKIAFIGKFAESPRFQGGGSSHINTAETLSALEAVRSVSPVKYARGFETDRDEIIPELVDEAVAIAKDADLAVLFLGLPDLLESESYDRTHMSLPQCQVALLEEIAKVQQNIAVVLHNGAPIVMPWLDKAGAVLEAYLGGQAVGGAVVDVLFGAVSPCGKLAETFPLRMEDTPCHGFFPGDGDRVTYAEDIYVGYRWYDKRHMDVLFPFGHGLSYTTFEYSNLRLSADTYSGGEMTVQVDVTNTGKMYAKEIVQLYVRPETNGFSRPVRELRGFAKLALAPGETGTVTIALDERAFALWREDMDGWYIEPGRYVIEAAASSRDIRLTADITAQTKPVYLPVTMDSTMADAMAIPGADKVLADVCAALDICMGAGGDSLGDSTGEMAAAMFREMPLHAIASFAGGKVTRTQLKAVVDEINQLI
ncbi:MAG: glycoside hydrolase family 3 C-terminal domain-containing protein [Clostridia bacterium]|nr:glycoside hydrolase family 3 C-terminal domain-containing protein [Clostridia bacterium]